MDRRKFLGWFTVGTLASSLPIVIAACSSKNDSNSTSSEGDRTNNAQDTPNAEGFLVVGTIQELEEKGQIIDKVRDIIVIRNPDSNALVALNSRCTHQGCSVNWDGTEKNLACPCHGSLFGVDGQVVKGPAGKPLSPYEIKEEEGNVLVKVA